MTPSTDHPSLLHVNSYVRRKAIDPNAEAKRRTTLLLALYVMEREIEKIVRKECENEAQVTQCPVDD